MEKIISVDSGRCKVKSMMYIDLKNSVLSDFESKYALVDFKYVKNIPILFFDKEKDIIASIDGSKPIAYGNVCDKLFPIENIHYVTDDIPYLEYSIKYTFISIAKFVNHLDKVLLGINLTANNINSKEEIRSKLSGEHRVIFYNNVGDIVKDVTFTIDKVGVFFQGWASYFNIITNENYELVNDKIKDEVIIFDLGRRTLDISLIHGVSPVKTLSYNCGVEKFLKFIKEQLYRQFNIHKKTLEIENLILNKKELRHKGTNIDLTDIIKYALDCMKMEIRNVILEDYSNYDPDAFYLTGGGSILFKDLFIELYSDIQVMDDLFYSNVKGLNKLLVRRFVKNQKSL